MIKAFLRRAGLPFIVMLALTGCAETAPFHQPNASGTFRGTPEQCVPYARRMSGIDLYGDAYSWWDKAGSRYRRGSLPAPGAVLVLARTPRMTSGHVAVVKSVLNSRQIDITHSNWGNNTETRRIVYDSMLAEDVSPANDWSQIRFWNRQENCFGFPYKARGFIYP